MEYALKEKIPKTFLIIYLCCAGKPPPLTPNGR